MPWIYWIDSSDDELQEQEAVHEAVQQEAVQCRGEKLICKKCITYYVWKQEHVMFIILNCQLPLCLLVICILHISLTKTDSDDEPELARKKARKLVKERATCE